MTSRSKAAGVLGIVLLFLILFMVGTALSGCQTTYQPPGEDLWRIPL